jgi:hypothetical protein
MAIQPSSPIVPPTIPLAIGARDPSVTACNWNELHREVRRFTQELFGIEPVIVEESDPETDDPYFAVQVTTVADVNEIVKLNDAWHRQLISSAGDWMHFYRLALHIV